MISRADQYIENSRSEHTKEAFERDAAVWYETCEEHGLDSSLPADEDTVVHYIALLAESGPAAVTTPWLEAPDQITTSDYARMTGMSQPGALKALDRLVRDGALLRGVAVGRNAHYHR